MIELSKWQLYDFLIALMTVTQKWCLKPSNNHKNYLYTQSEYFLLFCLYLQTIVVNNISMHISLPNKCIFSCSIRVIHEKYVTNLIYNNFWKRIIIGWFSYVVFFNFKTNYEVSTPISLKTNNNKHNYFILHVHICVVSTWKQTYVYIYIYIYIYTVVYSNCGIV